MSKKQNKIHELTTNEIPEIDFLKIRGDAIRAFVETKESDNVKIIIDTFLSYLISKGFRVVKK